MRERGIIFSAGMVNAILENRKTQTRRVMHPQPDTRLQVTGVGQPHIPESVAEFYSVGTDRKTGLMEYLARTAKHEPINAFMSGKDSVTSAIRCPYGVVGDRLRVRETHYRWGKWVKDGKTKTGRQRWRFKAVRKTEDEDGRALVRFEHNAVEEFSQGRETRWNGWCKRPSIFMPRKLSRITLELTGVRVERLQDISEEDAVAEGVGAMGQAIIKSERFGRSMPGAIFQYAMLWDSLHGKGAWDLNPWVWVLEFRKL